MWDVECGLLTTLGIPHPTFTPSPYTEPMEARAHITFQVGDYDELEAQRLEYWRSLSEQERLDEYVKLLSIWWGNRESTLKGTYRLTAIPPR